MEIAVAIALYSSLRCADCVALLSAGLDTPVGKLDYWRAAMVFAGQTVALAVLVANALDQTLIADE